MTVVRIGLPSLGLLWIAGCSQTAVENERAQAAPARAAVESAASAEPLTLTNYKSERERLALRGLTYETGRVVIDAEEARLVVDGFDAERAERELQAGFDDLELNERWEAVAAMTRAVLSAPEDARMYAGLGDALLKRRMATEAEAAYRTAVDLEPFSAAYHAKLATALSWQGESAASIDAMQRSLALDPQQGAVRERLAIQHYYGADYDAAWFEVHAAEALGQSVPPQFRALLVQRSPEPKR